MCVVSLSSSSLSLSSLEKAILSELLFFSSWSDDDESEEFVRVFDVVVVVVVVVVRIALFDDGEESNGIEALQ